MWQKVSINRSLLICSYCEGAGGCSRLCAAGRASPAACSYDNLGAVLSRARYEGLGTTAWDYGAEGNHVILVRRCVRVCCNMILTDLSALACGFGVRARVHSVGSKTDGTGRAGWCQKIVGLRRVLLQNHPPTQQQRRSVQAAPAKSDAQAEGAAQCRSVPYRWCDTVTDAISVEAESRGSARYAGGEILGQAGTPSAPRWRASQFRFPQAEGTAQCRSVPGTWCSAATDAISEEAESRGSARYACGGIPGKAGTPRAPRGRASQFRFPQAEGTAQCRGELGTWCSAATVLGVTRSGP